MKRNRDFCLTIGHKLLLFNLLIFAVFGLIILIIAISNANVERIITKMVNEEFDRITANAALAVNLSELNNRATLLVAKFYNDDIYLNREGPKLLEEIETLIDQCDNLPVSMALHTLNARLAELLGRCKTVKRLSVELLEAERRLLGLLAGLEEVTAEKTIETVLAGDDPSTFVQIGQLVPTFREETLRIMNRFVRIEPAYSTYDAGAVIDALDAFHLRLGTLPSAARAVSLLGRRLMEEVNAFKERFIEFDEEVARLVEAIRKIDETRSTTERTMRKIDTEIRQSAGRMRQNGVLEMRSSLRNVSILCGIVMVLLSAMTYLFFLLTFRRPMAAIQRGMDAIREGKLDTRLNLGRRDDWQGIESAMNHMVDDLTQSYITLYEKNAELERAGLELETYMRELTEEVAERRRAEVALRESTEKFESLSENAPDIIYTLDENGDFTYINAASKPLLDYGPGEMVGQPFDRFVRFPDESAHAAFFDDVRNRRKVFGNVEVVMLHKNGQRRVFHLSAAPNFDAGRRFSGVVGILKDITDHRQLEIQLQQHRIMESINTLAGGVAHDFNNLMMGIQGRVSLMKLKTDAADPNHRHLVGIETEIHRAADLTRRLMGPGAPKKEEKRFVDIHRILREQNRLFQRTWTDIAIREYYHEKLWQVAGNATKIEQALMNIYINAWQAMEGGGCLTVRTENRTVNAEKAAIFEARPGDFICVSIADTGAGMDEATLKRIFEPFFTTRAFGKGTGMGLFTTYNIVKHHGGFIQVYSEAGRGSRFLVFLPAANGPAEEAVDAEVPSCRDRGEAVSHDLLVGLDRPNECGRATATQGGRRK